MGGLQDRVAWVTGAGSGIGEAVALALAAEGAAVVLSGRRPAPLAALAARIEAAGGIALAHPADMTDKAQVDGAVAAALARFGRLDILVASAGLNIRDRHWDVLGGEGVDQVIHANLSSAFYCAAAVLPAMRSQGGGLLVHIASMAGRFIGGLSGPAYTAAKHGVVAMSHSINMAECVHAIRSTVVLPGEVATPILDQRPVPVSAEDRARMLQPDDVAALVRFVALLPPHAVLNEVMITPTWNRGYVAALQRPGL